MFIFEKFFCNKIDNPKDAKIITEIDANTSNLTKVELTYTPIIPKINEKITYHF